MTTKTRSAGVKHEIAKKKSTRKRAEASGKATAGKHPRHEKNPFRPGSSYATAFDILASRKSGIRRDEAVKLLAELTGKDEKHAGYDLAVLLSAKEGGSTGPRHRSCREGFSVKRENDHITLVIE
ncbi:MAG TPA: hypothetical protein PLE77_04785 [Kiritimatiellia bacterium]|nr:hypothetical protein [Kiritimatiellia bacterium]